VTDSRIGDCQDEQALQELGVGNYDICFVCISNDFQGSLEVTYLLKELGAQHNRRAGGPGCADEILQKIGADDVIHPEKEMAQRTAVKYSARNSFDYLEMTPEYVICELNVPETWVGRTVAEIDVRSKHNVNIIGVKKDDVITPFVSPNHVFLRRAFVIAGAKKEG
jgi:trk system potassium uptake protein TrkA